MSVSPIGLTSVVISCLAGGTRVSFLSGWFIDGGVGRDERSHNLDRSFHIFI